MTNYKKDLQAEQKAHALTKQELYEVREKLKNTTSKEVETKIRYIKTADLSQVSREELEKALGVLKG